MAVIIVPISAAPVRGIARPSARAAPPPASAAPAAIAFRRPGRFSDVLFVPPPDLRARVEIVKLKLRGKPLVEGGIDATEVARATELYSGADLEHVVESATEVALEQSLKGGQVRPLCTQDLLAATRRIRPSTLDWFASAKNFATSRPRATCPAS